jgi:hypothetical protein
MGLALVIALVLVPISRSLVCVTQNNEYALEWVGQALQPADPLCSGSSRPGGRLRAGMPALQNRWDGKTP